jgi:hypothetical protein
VAFLVFPLTPRSIRILLRNHKIPVAASIGMAILAFGAAAYYGPLTTQSSAVAQANEIATTFETNAGPRYRSIRKPPGSAALWNLQATYEGRVGSGRVLVLVFDTPKATMQVVGRSGPIEPGLIVKDNIVALYDPARLDRSQIRNLVSRLESATRRPMSS